MESSQTFNKHQLFVITFPALCAPGIGQLVANWHGVREKICLNNLTSNFDPIPTSILYEKVTFLRDHSNDVFQAVAG